MFELAIIGGGPAAVSAGVYASRKQLKTVFITSSWGGQSIVSDGIENWIGTIKIPGAELAKNLENHLKAYAEGFVTIKEGVTGEKVETIDGGFKVTLSGGESVEAKTVLIATGSVRRKLTIPGAEEFENKGITYCATCDGPLFSDQDVAVIGGGNAGFESAAQLAQYVKNVTIIDVADQFKADAKTVEKVLANDNVTGINNAKLKSIEGDAFVSSLTYTNTASGEDKTLPVTGVFVEIGAVPATELVKGIVDLTDFGQVKIDPWTQRASAPGIWAAGDCTNILYHQNNIASGDAVRALEDIYVHLKT